MELVLFALALITLLLVSWMIGDGIFGHRTVRFLRDTAPLEGDDLPRVTLIAPARNEDRDIEEAIRSQLDLDYPNLEVVVVDDRSTDRTGEILDGLAAEDARLNVVHVAELPEGWLGKNYANHLASRGATGEYLLFTDADIVMRRDTLRRAIAYMTENSLDHMAMTPDFQRVAPLLDAFVVTFIVFFNAYFKPWRAKNPKSRAFVGIGAFNLVRAEAYRTVGGHEAICMRPDDDVKLGKLLKRRGFRQEFVYGNEMIKVRWYTTVGEAIDGLMKNSFAGVDYNPLVIVLATAAIMILDLWPFAALFFTSGSTWWVNLSVVAVLSAGFIDSARHVRVPVWYSVLLPVCLLLELYILWRAMILTYVTGGIRWRGTHYRLADLKANKV